MNKKGFTLIESVIYISIVAVLLVAVTDFHFSLGGTASKLSASIDTSRNRRTALSNIDYLIRNADGLLKDVNGDCSELTATPPTLSLYFEDDTYLPGTCVSTGGGLNITIEDNRVHLECLPGITYNGEFQACSDQNSGNTHYLTSPTVKIANTDLTFSTSDVERFTNITTRLTVNSLTAEQAYLTSSAVAKSTISLRNQQDDGLIAWWKMDETGNSITSLTDSIGSHNASCSGNISSADSLIQGSSSALHLSTGLDVCEVTDTSDLNFENSFTLTAWIERDSTSADRKEVINKFSSNPNEGYIMYINNNQLVCAVYNNRISVVLAQNLRDQQNYYADFIACVYDQNAGQVRNYVYKEGDVRLATEVGVSSDIILVNSREDLFIGNSGGHGTNFFAGDLDEVRMYNRVLTSNEIRALGTQGATWDCGPSNCF